MIAMGTGRMGDQKPGSQKQGRVKTERAKRRREALLRNGKAVPCPPLTVGFAPTRGQTFARRRFARACSIGKTENYRRQKTGRGFKVGGTAACTRAGARASRSVQHALWFPPSPAATLSGLRGGFVC
jgi:hypothetical protein